MNKSQLGRRFLFALCISLVTACSLALAQSGKEEYHPAVGQEGKDVIWVPTPQTLVEEMLNMAKVTSKDFVIDLGSGDGRTVISAAKRGAHALGIEYNPDMVELSKRNAAAEKVSDKATFVKADLFESDFSKATVITMFLLPEINLKLRPRILELKPGTRIVSNSFDMGEWDADRTSKVDDGCTEYCTALLWIVPARVEGIWRFPQGELLLKQTFQMLSGTLRSGRNTTPIASGRLNGNQITFSAGGASYTGRVSGNRIEGIVRAGGKNGKWQAERY